MVKNSPACTNEEVNSTSESSCLVVDWNTTVDSKSLEFVVMMLQFCQFILDLNYWKKYRLDSFFCMNILMSRSDMQNQPLARLPWLLLTWVKSCTYLNCQLSRRAHHDCLDFALSKLTLFPQKLREWQSECKCFARASQVSCNDVLSVVNRVETVHLNGKEALVATRHHLLGTCSIYFREWGKLSVLHSVRLESLRSLLFTGQTWLFRAVTFSASIWGLFTFFSRISSARLLEIRSSYSHREKLSLLKICSKKSMSST